MTKIQFTVALLITGSIISGAAEPTHRAKKKRAVAGTSGQAAQSGVSYAQREDVMLAADDIAARRDLERDWVRQAMSQARYLPQVARLIQPPPSGTAKNWALYRSRFIEPIRIRAGVKFWRDNRDSLSRAEKETGVPAEIIVGILGIETLYGQQMGNLRVIDCLTTLAFDFPANHPRAQERSLFFKTELEQFLSLTHRTGVDPLTPLGSYAGAMGLPQFMPSSWVRHALDYDGDSRIDLFGSPADAIGSVANYLKAFQWQAGMPTHFPVRLDGDKLDLDTLLANDILPTLSVASLTAKGVVLDGAALRHHGALALIELQNGNSRSTYVAGTDNFYAITRYNWSSYYAMAVIELGQEIARAMIR
ncbi:MAG: lytic murein transglycosylase B [Rhodoferax sp.]